MYVGTHCDADAEYGNDSQHFAITTLLDNFIKNLMSRKESTARMYKHIFLPTFVRTMLYLRDLWR